MNVVRREYPNITRIARRGLPGAAALLALAGVLAITRAPGPGLDPDSASYLGAAESVARGTGLRIPIATWQSADSTAPLAHFPPGYSVALALPMRAGASPRAAARIVSALAAGVSLGAAAALVGDAAGSGAVALLVLLLLVMPALVDVHLAALSEPLFLALFALVLAAMTAAGRAAGAASRRETLLVILTGGLAALAALVRYAGVAACGAVGLWMLLLPGTLARRARRAALAALPMVLLLGAWVAHTRAVAGGRAIRELGLYGGIGATLREGLATLVAWLVPLSTDQTLPGRGALAAVAALALGGIAASGLRVPARQTAAAAAPHGAGSSTLAAATALLAATYLATLVASRLVADAGIPFDGRILAPLLFLLTIVLVSLGSRWWRRARPALRALLGAAVALWIAAALHVASDDVTWALDAGVDFAGTQWTTSPLIAWARTEGAPMTLYSNWPVAIYFHLHRPAHEIPADSADATLADFAGRLRATHGVVLAFDVPSPGFASAAALTRTGALRVVRRFADGELLVAADTLRVFSDGR